MNLWTIIDLNVDKTNDKLLCALPFVQAHVSCLHSWPLGFEFNDGMVPILYYQAKHTPRRFSKQNYVGTYKFLGLGDILGV